MMKAPEKLGSEYYRGFLTRQGQAFYDRINTQLLRGDYSGKTTFSLSNPETSASDGFAAYKAIRDDRPEFFFLGYQSEFTRSVPVPLSNGPHALFPGTGTASLPWQAGHFPADNFLYYSVSTW